MDDNIMKSFKDLTDVTLPFCDSTGVHKRDSGERHGTMAACEARCVHRFAFNLHEGIRDWLTAGVANRRHESVSNGIDACNKTVIQCQTSDFRTDRIGSAQP